MTVKPAVVSGGRRPYLAFMTAARLVRLFAMFALLLMPLAMAGQGHADAGHHQMASAGHHAGMEHGQRGEESQSGPSAECLMACTALPAAEAPIGPDRVAPQPLPVADAERTIAGLSPEAATPPPRSA